MAEKLGALMTTGVPEIPIEPLVEVRLTVPVAALVVTLALLMDALDCKVTVAVEVVPTVPERPRDPFVAVRSMVVPVIEVPLEELRLPAADRLKTLPAPELLVIVEVPAVESVM